MYASAGIHSTQLHISWLPGENFTLYYDSIPDNVTRIALYPQHPAAGVVYKLHLDGYSVMPNNDSPALLIILLQVVIL